MKHLTEKNIPTNCESLNFFRRMQYKKLLSETAPTVVEDVKVKVELNPDKKIGYKIIGVGPGGKRTVIKRKNWPNTKNVKEGTEHSPNGLKGLIQKIKGIFINEMAQGNKESDADYHARLQGDIAAGRFNALSNPQDRIRGLLGFFKNLEGEYQRSIPLAVRVMTPDYRGRHKHAQGMIVTGIRGSNLIGRPTGAGGHSASHGVEVITDIRHVTGLNKSFYASLRPDHLHTAMSILGDMFERKRKLKEEVVNRINKGTMSKSEIKERDRKAKNIKPQPIKGDTDDESRHRIATYITLRARGVLKTKKKT